MNNIASPRTMRAAFTALLFGVPLAAAAATSGMSAMSGEWPDYGVRPVTSPTASPASTPTSAAGVAAVDSTRIHRYGGQRATDRLPSQGDRRSPRRNAVDEDTGEHPQYPK